MKALLTTLLLCIIVSATAQKDAFYIKAGATASRDLIIPTVAAGVQFNHKNQLEFEYQQYRPHRSDWLNAIPDSLFTGILRPVGQRLNNWIDEMNKELPTQGWVSIRYSRDIPFNKVLSFRPTTSFGLNITGSDVDPRVGVSIGYSIVVHLGKAIDIQTITSFPLIHNQKATFKYLRVQNGIIGTWKIFKG